MTQHPMLIVQLVNFVLKWMALGWLLILVAHTVVTLVLTVELDAVYFDLKLLRLLLALQC